MPNGLEGIGQIIALIGGFLTILLGIIKLSEWWGKKGKEGEESPDLILEWNEGLTSGARLREDTEVYSLIIKNNGKIAAEDVEIRLYKAEQDGVNFIKQDERYILHRFESVKAGDSMPFTFIHDSRRINRLITPAGRDRVFDRSDVVFTFHITGLNIEPVIQKMIMRLDPTTNRFRIINL